MNDIDTDLIEFINENPFTFEEDIFERFNNDRKFQGKDKIPYNEYQKSFERLLSSNRIEPSTFGENDEFIFYKSIKDSISFKSNNEDQIDDKQKEILNRNVLNLTRIINFLKIKNGASSDELIEKFVYKPGHFDFDLKEKEFWHYMSFLLKNNCIKEERIDNYSFFYKPLCFSSEIFLTVENHEVVENRKKEFEQKKVKNISNWKILGIIILLLFVTSICLYIFAFLQTTAPIIITVITLFIIYFGRRKRIGNR